MRKFIFLFSLVCTISLYAWEITAYEIHSFFSKTEYKKVADIITAMSILETGWYRSEAHECRNNMFSIKRSRKLRGLDCSGKTCNKPICRMHVFKTKEEGYTHVLNYFRNKNFHKTKKEFYKDLSKKGYAEDPEYIKKLKWIIRNRISYL